MVSTVFDITQLDPKRPVLIAGATASGKSDLALQIAQQQGGVIVNADAIQVYQNWRILTARPSEEDERIAPHALYGHVGFDVPYSVGQWLRDVEPFLTGAERPIIVGGTGLYFTALTQGLADIPETPAHVRATADARLKSEGRAALLAELDAATAAKIDQLNPMRVQRAWEVLQTTGRGLADWQADTPPPLLPLASAQTVLFDLDKEVLNTRIATRFDKMVATGALEEVRENLPTWNSSLPSAKAIGARELIAYLKGDMTLEEACTLSTIATRQFAKRQRTWFRARMGDWTAFRPHGPAA